MKQGLQDWFNANYDIDAKLIYTNAGASQISWVRDQLATTFSTGLGHQACHDETAFVVSTHTSKSVRLPVYLLERPGLKLYLRGNFYDWKLSVDSDKEINANFDGLFQTGPPVEPEYTGDPLHQVYFEGFSPDWIYDYYERSNKKRFSAELWNQSSLWTAAFLILRDLGHIQAMRWNTRASHSAMLREPKR
jgi:hypothetical protein